MKVVLYPSDKCDIYVTNNGDVYGDISSVYSKFIETVFVFCIQFRRERGRLWFRGRGLPISTVYRRVF